jgi:hypothetical protein
MSDGLGVESPRRRALREWRDVDRCDHLLALHLAEAVHRLGAAALEVNDLPPLTGASVEAGQLRSVATLFWAKEVDAAGLLDFVDALAEGLVTGRLLLPLERGADKLAEYWRGRHERFDAGERQALFLRVFGDERAGDTVTNNLERLVASLAAIGVTLDAGAHVLAQVGVLGLEVAEQLSERSAGITAWAARDIVAQIKSTLALLEDREIAGPLGGSNAWTLIRLQSPMVLGHPIDPEPHLQRARAGLEIIQWLAQVATGLGAGGGLRLSPGDPVVRAAATWQVVSGHA